MSSSFEITPLVVSTFIFVATFIGFSLLFLYFQRLSSYRTSVNRRLVVESGNKSRVDALAQFRSERKSLSKSSLFPFGWLDELVLQSGTTLGKGTILLLTLLLMAGLFFIIKSFMNQPLIALSIAVIAGTVAPILILRDLRARRMAKFEALFPDAMDTMARCLRAGHPINVALATVAKEVDDPVGNEFHITAEEINYGLDLETAMANLRSRVGQHDLALVVISVSLQAQTGGNLAEILGNLSQVVRNRFKVRRKVKSLSAEGRFSALVLSIVPFLIFGGLWIISPDFYGSVWNTSYVQPVLAASFVWLLIGNIVMRKMVNLKI